MSDAMARTTNDAAETPIIEIRGGGLSDQATRGEAAIIKSDAAIFQRGANLVRPVVEEVDAAHGRRTKVAQLAEVREPYMLDLLCRSARWERYDRRREENVTCDPPSNVARVILNRYGEWSFDTVVGVITTPTLRPDGSLLADSGYDPTTRLILVEPPSMPALPTHPAREDAEAALSILDALLTDFPFVNEASRSVALSAMITPIVRGAFTVTPMHAIRAPTPGSGKSFLFDIVAAIALGQPCPVMAAGRTEEETEKRLVGALRSGQPIISVDNVNGDLGGDALCQIIERPIVEIRILGKSEMVRIETRSTVLATGNNLRLLGDMTRRVVLCTLDAREERPELRRFSGNPVAKVLEDRGSYIAAALTIVRAYILAGRPNRANPLGSFEGWSNTVRSALMWLGRTDPVDTMEMARDEDPHLQAMRSVFAAWAEKIRMGRKVTAAQIVNIAEETSSDLDVGEWRNPDLRDALLTVAQNRAGRIDAREFGKWLSRHCGRVLLGARLVKEADSHGHPAKWSLVECGSSGSSGSFPAAAVYMSTDNSSRGGEIQPL